MGAKNVNSETCTVLNFKALFGVVTGGEKGKCSQLMKARLQVDSIGSHSSWHVEYYLHISLWKRCRLSEARVGRPSRQCVELPLSRWQIVSRSLTSSLVLLLLGPFFQ